MDKKKNNSKKIIKIKILSSRSELSKEIITEESKTKDKTQNRKIIIEVYKYNYTQVFKKRI